MKSRFTDKLQELALQMHLKFEHIQYDFTFSIKRRTTLYIGTRQGKAGKMYAVEFYALQGSSQSEAG